MTADDLHYLRSILGHLREVRAYMADDLDRGAFPTLGSEILADNIDWLDCFIDQLERRIGALRPGTGHD